MYKLLLVDALSLSLSHPSTIQERAAERETYLKGVLNRTGVLFEIMSFEQNLNFHDLDLKLFRISFIRWL